MAKTFNARCTLLIQHIFSIYLVAARRVVVVVVVAVVVAVVVVAVVVVAVVVVDVAPDRVTRPIFSSTFAFERFHSELRSIDRIRKF